MDAGTDVAGWGTVVCVDDVQADNNMDAINSKERLLFFMFIPKWFRYIPRKARGITQPPLLSCQILPFDSLELHDEIRAIRKRGSLKTGLVIIIQNAFHDLDGGQRGETIAFGSP